jgi:hypothetical protein
MDITQCCDTTKETNVTYFLGTDHRKIWVALNIPVLRRQLFPFTGTSHLCCMLSESLWPCTISVPKALDAYVLPTTQVGAITRRAHGRSLAAFKSHPLSEIGEHWTELYLPYFAKIQGKVIICFKAVAMIQKYLLVCKKYPQGKVTLSKTQACACLRT